MRYTNYSKKLMADLLTPLGVYLRLRENCPLVFLLESSDYSSREESKSFLCFDSLSSFILTDGELTIDDSLLNYQAGAGLVISSDAHSEMLEVGNKLAALKSALSLAQTLV